MWPFKSESGEQNEKRSNLAYISTDIEDGIVTETHLMNNDVRNVSWKGVTIAVKDGKTGEPRIVLDNIDGVVRAGM
jgi:hypothetical protein